MFSKNSLKILWTALIVLLVGFFILQFTDHSERTFPETLVTIDTANIDHIIIKLPKNGGNIEVSKTDGSWQVKEDKHFYKADEQKVWQLLGSIATLKPKNLAARSSRQWEKYQVNDSLGTRIILKSGSTTSADLILGRISVKMPANQNTNPYMRQQQEILMYARSYDEELIYVVDGMLKLGLGRNADDFRENLFCKLPTGEIRQLSFSYPGQATFTLKKQGDKWLLDDEPADSSHTVKYLRNFSNSRGSRFVNNFIPDKQQQYRKITVQSQGSEPLVLLAYQTDSTHFVLHSSINEESYFDGENGKLFEKFFVQKNEFESGGPN
jgi:hypothetical protein